MYEYSGNVLRVVDGDTYDLLVDLGFRIQIKIRTRLYGGDTYEVRGEERPLGLKAKAFAEEFLEGEELLIRTYKTGKYGRWLVDLHRVSDGLSLLVALGNAGHLKE